MSTDHTTIGFVSAFLSETRDHSPYNILTLSAFLGSIPDSQLLLVSNGCKLSNKGRTKLASLPNASLIEEPLNIGVPGAWNHGFEKLDCDYLFVLNDDILLDQICIQEMIHVFKKRPDTAVVGVEGVQCQDLSPDGFPKQKKRYRKKKRLLNFKRILDVSNVSGFCFAISMQFVRETGFRFDEQFAPAFCEEFDLAFFARDHGYKTRIITGLGDHYHHIYGVSQTDTSISFKGKTILSSELSKRNMKLFVQKWKTKAQKLVCP